MAQASGGTVLEVEGVTKTFPGVVANDDVSLTLNQGEIHCLLGENGAGKSTLMNMVFGLYRPDRGTIRVRGEAVNFQDSGEAIDRGIGMVHQHFQLIPVFTVAENIILGNEVTKGAFLDLDSARRQIDTLAERYGLAVDPDATVGDLSVGEQQRVELVKALFRDADILILDEPTAVLTPGEVDDFFEVVEASPARASPSSSSPTSCARCWPWPTASPCCGPDGWWAPPPLRERPSSRWPT